MLTCGSRGDVQPFLPLSLGLGKMGILIYAIGAEPKFILVRNLSVEK